MKNSVLILCLLISNHLFSQSKEELDVQKTVENMFQTIYSDLDESKINSFFTPNFMLFEDGEIRDLSYTHQMVENLKKQFQNEENRNRNFQRINSFEFLRTSIHEDIALLYYTTSASFYMNDLEIANMKWLQSANLIKVEGQWKIQHLHSTIQK